MKLRTRILLFLLLSTVVVGSVWLFRQSSKPGINYGISPYQDTILPVVAEKMGWYAQEGLPVRLKVLAWGDVMTALAGGGVDVAIQNFNSFQAAYWNLRQRGIHLVFYYPLFIFKGAAIMIRNDSKLHPLSYFLARDGENRDKAVMDTVKQLRGKTIITTEGTEMEQIVLEALQKAGMSEKDVNIINAQPEDGLNAFLHGTGDAYSGGLTERTEAAQHGALTMIEAADVGPPVIDGLVTTAQYAETHAATLQKLIELWFKTINFMNSNLDTNSKIVLDYLNQVAATKYTVDQYKYTWTQMEVYPESPAAVARLLMDKNSPYYWPDVWNANNSFLKKTGQISKAVPMSASWIDKVQQAPGNNQAQQGR